jgi:hypothetical protein
VEPSQGDYRIDLADASAPRETMFVDADEEAESPVAPLAVMLGKKFRQVRQTSCWQAYDLL